MRGMGVDAHVGGIFSPEIISSIRMPVFLASAAALASKPKLRLVKAIEIHCLSIKCNP